jgi:Pentapeptide repeats (8 copies)
MSLLLSLIAFGIFFGLAGFFWFWWSEPNDQVPPHLSEEELRRLEVQDRLRQTNYQILTALGLGATFLATIFQFSITSRQWSADYDLKSAQERLTQYTEAIKAVTTVGNVTANVAGITTLQLLAVQDPARFHQQASEVLTQFIAENQKVNRLRGSGQCEARGPEDLKEGEQLTVDPYDREEAPMPLKVAMQAIGHPQLAPNRLNYADDKCQDARLSVDHGPLWLEHMFLGNLDLSGRNFSCAKMSQSSFHRTTFNGADLRGADLRGTQLADFDTPGFPSKTMGRNLYLKESDGGPPEWQRYRCWTTDFRGAQLNAAKFEGAYLAGADFRGAVLTQTNFCRADISRANFVGAKGLTAEMLADACVGSSIDKKEIADHPENAVVEDAQPFGIDVFGSKFRVRRCLKDKRCGDE